MRIRKIPYHHSLPFTELKPYNVDARAPSVRVVIATNCTTNQVYVLVALPRLIFARKLLDSRPLCKLQTLPGSSLTVMLLQASRLLRPTGW